MTEKQFIQRIAPLATKDYQKTGILASVTIAQACLESGYGSTDLAQDANNLFGMKANLSGNTWKSVWDGKSIYTKVTNEEYVEGDISKVTADFRSYPNIKNSITDHSLYLTQAKNGSKLRYEGLVGEEDYKKAIEIIKNGGYATDSRYVAKVCSVIEKWDLTKYDKKKRTEVNNIIIKQNDNFGTHNTSIRNDKIKYIVIHYVGATGDADDNIRYYNLPTTNNASADFYVGHKGDLWQYNPDPEKRYCWAVGGGRQSSYGGKLYGIAKNSNCVSIEICVLNNSNNRNPNSPGWVITNEAYAGAVKLTKYLMDLYDIPVDRVIRHYDVNGKYCPGVIGWNEPSGSEARWKKFKEDIKSTNSNIKIEEEEKEETSESVQKECCYRVRKTWADKESQLGAYSVLENAKKACKEGYSVFDENGKVVYSNKKPKEEKKEFIPYQVKVTAAALNYRKGPGTNYAINGVIKDQGVYTIVEEKDNWGRLMSGAGWIALQYTKKI